MTSSDLLRETEMAFTKAIERLHEDFAGLQIGRASSALVESLSVETYGSHQPLKNVASISVPDAKTLFIQPWDRAALAAIEKAIRDSRLNLNPNNDGIRIVLNIPPLTEERRRDLTKLVSQMAEDAKISVRRHRQDAMNTCKRLAKEADSGITEDEEKSFEKRLQEKVDEVNKTIEELSKKKETDIMTV